MTIGNLNCRPLNVPIIHQLARRGGAHSLGKTGRDIHHLFPRYSPARQRQNGVSGKVAKGVTLFFAAPTQENCVKGRVRALTCSNRDGERVPPFPLCPRRPCRSCEPSGVPSWHRHSCLCAMQGMHQSRAQPSVAVPLTGNVAPRGAAATDSVGPNCVRPRPERRSDLAATYGRATGCPHNRDLPRPGGGHYATYKFMRRERNARAMAGRMPAVPAA